MARRVPNPVFAGIIQLHSAVAGRKIETGVANSGLSANWFVDAGPGSSSTELANR
jgi:hypothetical protein